MLRTLMKCRSGFTLIEILIVVVILAVLATIVVPRFLSRPESALIAEANQQLGALARAQDHYMQMTGNQTNGLSPLDWFKLGLQEPDGGRFTYSCTETSCTAGRVVSGATVGTITINYTTRPATFDCDGTYYILSTNSRGCTKL